MKNKFFIGLTATIISLLFFTSAHAIKTDWMNQKQFNQFTRNLDKKEFIMSRLECYQVSAKKRQFRVHYRKNRRERQWHWAVKSSVINLHRKYTTEGYKRVSLSSNVGLANNWQCAVWVK